MFPTTMRRGPRPKIPCRHVGVDDELSGEKEGVEEMVDDEEADSETWEATFLAFLDMGVDVVSVEEVGAELVDRRVSTMDSPSPGEEVSGAGV
jgi:hypothetical protein